MNVLCFTTTYRRPYFIYNAINSILNQSYSNITYNVNINLDSELDQSKYDILLNDFISDSRLKLRYSKNSHQHINYINAIKISDINEYDLFFKIDDDDIYHKNYIIKSIEYYKQYNSDILSYISKYDINNNKIKDSIKSIGVWNPDQTSNIKFGMPSTFIFNKKACEIILNIPLSESKKIHHFEDGSWKEYWRKHHLNSTIIENENLFTYNIHGGNASSSYLIDANKNIIENEYMCVVYVEHPKWKSYVYLNKRNKRIYNVTNNDHGAYNIIDNKLIVKWDSWGKEEFVKQQLSNTIYFYKKL